ncbi:ABC transporter substrate-binding protein [Leifsonia poae]|uniref:ABC transporter substrate-binding protein n=1 Tax=Leifsonia poae TaxID=110933 RepID=UPI003D67C725
MRLTRNPRSRAVIVAASVIAASALLLSGCSIKPSSGGDSKPSTNIMLGADDGSPTYTRNFNPFSANARLGVWFIYEPLQIVNPLDGKETPALASASKIVDSKTVTFTIRTGVKWSDGKDFSVQDVLYTFDLLKKNPALDVNGVWGHIASITSSGDDVTFALNGDDVPAEAIISKQLIVPEHVWSKIADPTKSTVDEPVGTGPYKLGKFGDNQYVLAKNDDYRDADKVAAETITYTATNTQEDIVKNGRDWAYAYMPDVEKTWVGADQQHNSYWFPPGGTITLIPNMKKAPYDDVNFREGLSLALNRTKIAESAVNGYTTGASQTGLILPNEKASLDDTIPDQGNVKQDTSAALDAFAKAGYTKHGDKLTDASGKQLTVSITVPNDYTDWLQGLQAVQTQLGALGIDVQLDKPEEPAYRTALANGDFGLAMSAMGGSGSLFQDYNLALSSSFAVPAGEAASSNFGRYSDPDVDKALDQLKSSTDPAAQKEAADAIQQKMVTQLPVITLYYGGLWGLYNDAHFTGWPSAKDPYAPPSTWMSTVLLYATHLKRS